MSNLDDVLLVCNTEIIQFCYDNLISKELIELNNDLKIKVISSGESNSLLIIFTLY
jgi:hypothetical protein